MIRGKLVRVIGYYNDPSYIERVIASFRRLLIDIDWIYGRRVDDQGLYELYLYVREHPNLNQALLNLSKTVGIERVDVFNEVETKIIEVERGKVLLGQDKTNNRFLFVLYMPIYSQAVSYSWGEIHGENI